METSVSAMREQEEARKKKGLATDGAWFWICPGTRLPKAAHVANIFLLQDDVPNFLRYWMNSYAAMVAPNGKLWEAGHLGSFGLCDAPDNGTAGWFIENFRTLLVMEDGDRFWVARATPRVWLEQGKRISVKEAPTYFGNVSYEIVSDVDHGTITATIDMPSRHSANGVLLRLRHPKAAPIKSVTVNGQPWTEFKKDKEVIELVGLQGRLTVVANY